MKHALMGLLALKFLTFTLGMAFDVQAQETDAMTLPADASSDCRLSDGELASWFAEGKTTKNGIVAQADSQHFARESSVCDFYKWGSQMFLWVTSPMNVGDREVIILDGPPILDVLPEVYDDASNKMVRSLEHNTVEGRPTQTAVRNQKFDWIGSFGAGALLSQEGSLVYSGVHVNDVYAYFATGFNPTQTSGEPSFRAMSQFPNDSDDMAAIQTYMNTHHPDVTFHDANAMVMELKTSWVDAETVDQEKFVLMHAEVPRFEPKMGSDNMVWEPAGKETKTLALTGIHIVGTVKDHPEFVWSTFEHVSNAPDNTFVYTTKDGIATQDYDPRGRFTFRADGVSLSGANRECMTQVSDSQAKKLGVKVGAIVAVDVAEQPVFGTNNRPACDGGIVSSDTVRDSPWGGYNALATRAMFEPAITDTATNNGRLITLNRDIIEQLKSIDDVRQYYVQIGSMWTSLPQTQAKASVPYRDGKAQMQSEIRGSTRLYNSTMETYTYAGSPNCFSCHAVAEGATDDFGPFALSHIFSKILPLETATAND